MCPSLQRREHKINKISSEKILKDTLMFPPRDKLINLNLNKNFCLRDKKKQKWDLIFCGLFLSDGEAGPENIVICYVMRIIRAWSLCSQEKSRKTQRGELSWEAGSQIDINVGFWLITGMFCAIVSLSIIKYQYFRFPSECSMLPSHETWNLFSCKFNILTLTVWKQCWLQLLACNLNAS